MGADRRSDRGAGFDFEIIVTCGLCAVAHFSECFLARETVWLRYSETTLIGTIAADKRGDR